MTLAHPFRLTSFTPSSVERRQGCNADTMLGHQPYRKRKDCHDLYTPPVTPLLPPHPRFLLPPTAFPSEKHLPSQRSSVRHIVRLVVTRPDALESAVVVLVRAVELVVGKVEPDVFESRRV
jgi:hypothetical protein